MIVKHLMQAGHGRILIVKIQICMQVVSGIQHKAFLFVMYLFKQCPGIFRVLEGQTRPPQVFHEEPEMIGLPVQKFINERCSGIDHFSVRVFHLIGETFFPVYLYHMKDHIFRTHTRCIVQIFPVVSDQFLSVLIHPVLKATAVNAGYHVRLYQWTHAGLLISFRCILCRIWQWHYFQSIAPMFLIKLL